MQAQVADPTPLELLEPHLRSIIETQPACLTRVSAGGAFLAVNDAALALLGADRLEQVLGTTLFSLMRPEQQPEGRLFLQRVIGGERSSLELDLVSLAGATATLQAHGIPLLEPPDGLASALLVFRDVSEQRRLETSVIELMTRQAELTATHDAERVELTEALERAREERAGRLGADQAERTAEFERLREEQERRWAAAASAHATERAQLLVELRQSQERFERGTAEHLARVADLQRALDQSDERKRGLETELAAQDQRAAALLKTLGELKGQHARTEQELSTRAEALAQLRRERDQAVAASQAQEKALAATHAAEQRTLEEGLEAAASARDYLSRSLDEATAQHRLQCAAHDTALAEKDARATALQTALGAASGERDRLARMLDDTTARYLQEMEALERAEADLQEQFARERQALQQRLGAAVSAQDQLTRRLDEAGTRHQQQIEESKADHVRLRQALDALTAQQAQASQRLAEFSLEKQSLEQRLHRDQQFADAGRLATTHAADIALAVETMLERTQALLRLHLQPNETREHLEKTRAAALTADAIVSRLVKAPAATRQALTRVNAAIDAFLPTLRHLPANVSLTSGSADGAVALSEGQIQQLVLSCVLGARPSMLADGHFLIETADVEVDDELARERGGVRPGDHVLVAVHASSTNIAERLLPLIGAPATAAVWQDETTCLGAVSRAVTRIGGHVWVTPETPDCVAFEIYLLKAAPQLAMPADAAQEAGTH